MGIPGVDAEPVFHARLQPHDHVERRVGERNTKFQMKTIAKILLILAFATAVHAQDSTSTVSTNDVRIIPLVNFQDVPITAVIQNLARQAELNCLTDPQLEQTWHDAVEPSISCKIENVTAKFVLRRILELRHLALLEDAEANIAFIIPERQAANPLFAHRLSVATNSPLPYTNGNIPLIQFSDVPITTAIENLARQAGVNYMIDPKLGNLWNFSSPKNVPEPLLNIRFEKVTAKDTLNGILNSYHFILVEDAVTHVARITRAGEPWPLVDASLLDMNANPTNAFTNGNGVVPLIQFADVPLDDALKNLIRASEANIKLDPRVKPEPQLTLRWENVTAKQALVALCQNYGLVIVKDSKTGVIQIKPR